MRLLRSKRGGAPPLLIAGLLGVLLFSPSLVLCVHEGGRLSLETTGQSLACCLRFAQGVRLGAADGGCSDSPASVALSETPSSGALALVAVALVPLRRVETLILDGARRALGDFESREARPLRERRTVVLQA